MNEDSLTKKYSPKKLDDVIGQDHVTSYFKSVVKRPDQAHKNYVILGPYGCGKTATARCFANEMLGVEDAQNTVNYLEIDSSDQSIIQDFNSFRDYIFQEVPGYKIVVLDEIHLLDKSYQQKFLKPLEDYVGKFFFFFLSTEENGIMPTIMSRSINFNMHTFSEASLEEYTKRILALENVSLREDTIRHIVFSSYGHMRNLLNQIEICIFQGEDFYVKQYRSLDQSVEAYFRSADMDVIDGMTKVPFEILRRAVEYYIFNVIIKGKKVFRPADIPKLFVFYLKLKRYVVTEGDFYSFLYAFKEYFNTLQRI